ncbi:MAG TPA: LytTR family DNA-binding domain-containing protein [Arachidicoccus sp.]|nr:LytTR family DNA-binding domain-containing protein [Arachidicoccus sp.]
MMRCLAIDDEKLVLELLEDNIRQVSYLQLVGSCRNAMEAAALLQQEQVDLIFMDIQMPSMDGLSFLRTLPHPPLTILVTAYSQYAIEGFDLNVVDYLMKPVSFERFLQACNRAHELYLLQQRGGIPQTEARTDHFFVNVEYTLVKIITADILYIEGLKDYIKIYLSEANRPVITRMSLKAMEEKLPNDKFVRIHKSYIVSIDKITTIKRDLIYIDDIELPLSSLYKAEIDRLIGR